MKTQKHLLRQNLKMVSVAGLSLLTIVAILGTVRLMALQDDTIVGSSGATERPLLNEPPTSSVTTSITNGVYVRNSNSKLSSQERSASFDTNSSDSTSAAPGGKNRMKAVTPAGPRTLSGLSLYVDPSLRLQGRQERIASQPVGRWFGGWNADVRGDVSLVVAAAAQSRTVPVLVAYNIPVRDCGSYSAGGANSSAAYREWIQDFADGIELNKAVVILEPDALPGLDCLSLDGQRQRLSDLSFAVNALAATGAATYLDAGNYSWHLVSVMSQRLKDANVASARGVSLNVSGYGWTDKSISYGQQLVTAIGGAKGFVIDTSRNGNGPAPNNEWCNPRGRALGNNPTTSTGVASLDAYLWVKVPGESDGTCNGGPSAGVWWDEIANELIANAR